jgi:hypothetical protein
MLVISFYMYVGNIFQMTDVVARGHGGDGHGDPPPGGWQLDSGCAASGKKFWNICLHELFFLLICILFIFVLICLLVFFVLFT